MQIRTAKQSDAHAIASIYNACFADRIRKLNPVHGYHPVTDSDVEKWLTEDRSRIFLSEEHDSVVGFCHTCMITDVGENPVEVGWIRPMPEWELGQSNIAVQESYRRRGVGRHMLSAAIGHFVEHSVDVIEALTFSDSNAAEALFKGLGFESRDVFYWDRYSRKKPLANSTVYAIKKLKEHVVKYKDPQTRIRRASLEDVPVIAQIHEENTWWCKECSTKEWNRKYIEGEFGQHVFVCERKGEVVGCIDYLPNGRIGIAGILDSHKQKGIGTVMLDLFLDLIRREGLNEAFADSGLTQTHAIALYKKLGFNLERRQNCWVKILRE
jgi:ribosomal protein S18 acetylase RimI-like enzyme